jgi:hypothetical protein
MASSTTAVDETWSERRGRGHRSGGRGKSVKHDGLKRCIVSFHHIRRGAWADGRRRNLYGRLKTQRSRTTNPAIRESIVGKRRGVGCKRALSCCSGFQSDLLHPFTIRWSTAVVFRFSPISGFHQIRHPHRGVFTENIFANYKTTQTAHSGE